MNMNKISKRKIELPSTELLRVIDLLKDLWRKLRMDEDYGGMSIIDNLILQLNPIATRSEVAIEHVCDEDVFNYLIEHSHMSGANFITIALKSADGCTYFGPESIRKEVRWRVKDVIRSNCGQLLHILFFTKE